MILKTCFSSLPFPFQLFLRFRVWVWALCHLYIYIYISKTQDPGLRIQNPESRILNPGSWLQDPESRILNSESWIISHNFIQYNYFRNLLKWSRNFRKIPKIPKTSEHFWTFRGISLKTKNSKKTKAFADFCTFLKCSGNFKKNSGKYVNSEKYQQKYWKCPSMSRN